MTRSDHVEKFTSGMTKAKAIYDKELEDYDTLMSIAQTEHGMEVIKELHLLVVGRDKETYPNAETRKAGLHTVLEEDEKYQKLALEMAALKRVHVETSADIGLLRREVALIRSYLAAGAASDLEIAFEKL